MIVEPGVLGGFALAAATIVVAPGPDTMLILRNALAAGRRTGLATVAGIQTGLLIHTLLAAAGVSAVIASSPTLFRILAVAGAGYLGWLGIQGLRGAGGMAPGSGGAITVRRAFRDAVLCNVLNPKVLLLFLALYPNFVDVRSGPAWMQVAVLSVVLVLINLVWQVPFACSADAARGWLLHPAVRTTTARITGAILLGFAVLLLWQHAA